MTWIFLLGLAFFVFVLIAIAVGKARTSSVWHSTTGEIVSARHEESPGTSGVAHHFVVVVRTDDGRRLEFVDPPGRKFGVGYRLDRGVLSPPLDRGSESAEPPV